MQFPEHLIEYVKKSVELVLSGRVPRVERSFPDGAIAKIMVYRCGSIVRCDIKERVAPAAEDASAAAINLILRMGDV